MFRSIRWRIALPFIGLILIVMLGLGIYLSYYLRHIQTNRLENSMYSQALVMSESLASRLDPQSDVDDTAALIQQWSNLLGARLTLISPDGTVVADSHEDPSKMENHFNRPEVQAAFEQSSGMSIRYSQTLGMRMLYVALPITVNQQILGVIRIALPVEQIDKSITQLQKVIIIGILIFSALSIVIASIIAERTTRPIRQLTSAVQKFSTEEFDQGLLESKQDEIGRLTQAFVNVSTQLQDQISSLKVERSKFAAVLEQMNDGVLIVDEKSQIQLINPAAELMFNITATDVIEQSLAISIRNHKIIELWRVARASSTTQSMTLDLSSLSLILQGTAIPLDEPLPGSTLMIFQDLTNIRRLETIRRDFISNISHELRTPLASLKALTETLLAGALEDPPASRKFLERMETEVDSLTLMVQELVELSRIESGKVPLHLQPIAPANLLQIAMDRLGLQAERAGHTINLILNADVPQVLCDQHRIEQVLVNLLHNAIKFTPQGGEINLTARKVDSSVQFSVSDTGVGIPADDIPRIFERFFKSDRARSESGTGLGLAIARHLVEAHHGRIWAESVEGQGSTFYFTLPTV